MTQEQALEQLRGLSEKDFDDFYNSLPPRAHLLIDSNMVGVGETLAQWWIARHTEGKEVENVSTHPRRMEVPRG